VADHSAPSRAARTRPGPRLPWNRAQEERAARRANPAPWARGGRGGDVIERDITHIARAGRFRGSRPAAVPCVGHPARGEESIVLVLPGDCVRLNKRLGGWSCAAGGGAGAGWNPGCFCLRRLTFQATAIRAKRFCCARAAARRDARCAPAPRWRNRRRAAQGARKKKKNKKNKKPPPPPGTRRRGPSYRPG